MKARSASWAAAGLTSNDGQFHRGSELTVLSSRRGTLPAVSTDSSGLLSHVLVLHGLPAYLFVGTLAFAEAALFVGFVLPGETAVILGGVLASQHAASLTLMIAVVVAAIVGDSVGYEVGQRFGPRTLQLRLIKRWEK